MSKYLTRVELHGGTSKDYGVLHSGMTDEGYSNKIKGGNGIWYSLPPAEYRLEDDCTIETARSRAKRAADATGRKSAIVVSEYEQAAWNGLEKV